MRVFAVSDIHVDYIENREWLTQLSSVDYRQDILILAGDVTDDLMILEECFAELADKFLKVLFVPGNHELWVSRDKIKDSIEKLKLVHNAALAHGIAIAPFHIDGLSIVPLVSWYDFSFGEPSTQLLNTWTDFRACRWPNEMKPVQITSYFMAKNEEHLQISNNTVISFSHFLPRIDLMPIYIPQVYRYIYPALGCVSLEQQIRKLAPDIHVYGHSHVNRNVTFEGIQYINNAFAYPSEKSISKKRLLCIYEH
ncbi:metallophosphoesterase [Colwelliaceae bacterium 6441]